MMTDNDIGAKLIAEFIGYSWDGLREGRIEGFPVLVPGGTFQGGKQDLRDIAEKVAAEATAALRERVTELEAWNRQMVEKAASGGVLDGYRELGQRAAKAQADLEEALEVVRGALTGLIGESGAEWQQRRRALLSKHGGGEG